MAAVRLHRDDGHFLESCECVELHTGHRWLDDPLHPLCADHARQRHGSAVAEMMGTDRQHSPFVAQHRLCRLPTFICAPGSKPVATAFLAMTPADGLATNY